MILLYFIGIIFAITAALIFRRTLFKGEPVPFVMELPNYRMPGIKNVAQLLWEKRKTFSRKPSTIIFLATIVIWVLQNFDFRFNVVEDSKSSILASIAGVIAPVFSPAGFGDWRICTALICGFMAKESVVQHFRYLYQKHHFYSESYHL